ncbi:MAG TPA: GAF domain-containing protein [Thiolapillus brandeum]|uniref:GAF domain-containing protein n=1 Tax=Thiolapillus brandeum TaxID=1076588 RepID=A0A831RWJ9_9GAMM|nr:GAF domain-containing protein [Thiolapillus brandeum]
MAFILNMYKNAIKPMEGQLSKDREREKHRDAALSGRLELLYKRERYLSGILRLVSEVNQVILRSVSLDEILEKSCERITRHEAYCVAWIGLVEPDQDELTVGYQSDHCDPPYLGDSFRVTLAPGEPHSRGPAGRCILGNHLVVVENTQTDPGFAAWRERAARSGIHSVAGLPLRAKEGIPPIGCLLIYLRNPDGFSSREVIALQDVADSIGRAIYLRREMDQRILAEKAVRDSEARFKQLIDALPNVAVQGYDQAHRVIYWNKSSEVLYGYSSEEAAGRCLEELIIPNPCRRWWPEA